MFVILLLVDVFMGGGIGGFIKLDEDDVFLSSSDSVVADPTLNLPRFVDEDDMDIILRINIRLKSNNKYFFGRKLGIKN